MTNDDATSRSTLHRIGAVFLLCLGMLATSAAHADADDDREAIRAMLGDFLANVGDVAVHERFWGDDLVYTSSGGARFGRQDILHGMRAEEPGDADTPQTTYRGRDVDIRLYGDTAVLAFRLVATSPGDGAAEQYFNTGTLVRRDGRWQVVAWQATRIPAGDSAAE